jgi:anaerobic magnesium-protoporphyrin IX monomethyl ester cyclase
MKTRLLFITNFAQKYSAVSGYVPLGTLSLIGALRSAGHEVEVAPARFADASAALKRWRPSIVAYSALTGDVGAYLVLNRRLKDEHEFLAVFGGPHPTYFPDVVSSAGVDAVCRGEGEEALVDLAGAVADGRDYLSTPNFWFSRDGRIVRNGVRPLCRDLDELPRPDRDFWFARFPQVGRSPRKQFMASRGCPYHCTFCFNHKFNELYENKNVLRRRGVDSIIDEVCEVIGRHPAQQIHFLDDTFNLDKAWLEEFCSRYAKEVALPFFCNVRANLVDEETVAQLARAGCRVVAFGIESGNDHIRERVLKRNMSAQSILRTADLLHRYGIKFITFNIIGFPDETLENMRETVAINRRCRPDYAYISIFQPYPSTDYAEEILRRRGGTIEDILEHPEIFPESFLTSSMLPGKAGLQVERLHRLFSLLVEHPGLETVYEAVKELPVTPALTLAKKLHAAYTYKKIYDFRLSPDQYAHAIYDILFKNTV